MAKLVVISSSLAGVSHELGGAWATLGRADGNTFQLVEGSISGRHCEVQLRGDELVVRDLRSTNGTFVRGEKITEAVVKAGQTLRLGEVELRFEAATPETSFTSKMLVTPVAALAAKPAPLPAATGGAPATTGGGPAKKFQVLFVDDSMAFHETFGRLCSELANQTWEIHSAMTADRALALLQQKPVDLVVLDIGMPMLDGIQLLGIINRRYPGIKVAVITGNASEANRAAALSSGAELFLEKPVSAEGIQVVFNMLNDLVSWTYHEGFSGSLRQVGLTEIIQMECIGRHTSILEIRNQQLRGQVYIEAGAIIHAAAGALTGEPALYQLLSLAGGEFHLHPFKAPPQRTIGGSWEVLLMEAARICDEETVQLKKPSAPADGSKK